MNEPGMVNGSWDNIPESWKQIRFDAVDILFISPIFINKSTYAVMIATGDDGGSFQGRFDWIIRAARTKNPNVKIILEAFYGDCPGGSDFRLLADPKNDQVGVDMNIKNYSKSVAAMIESYYNKTFESINDPNNRVSGRINGYDIDVESGTMRPFLPKIVSAVRDDLNLLSQRQFGGGAHFTVSLSPAWGDYLDSSMAQSCDYINMQNYSGGKGTTPDVYMRAIRGLRLEQLVWGFTPEKPSANTTESWASVKTAAQEVANGKWPGTYTWRLNSDNTAYENIFQVWLYNIVHGTTLLDSKSEDIVSKYWTQFGGRIGHKEGQPLAMSELN
jgi:hypothetical protein